MADTTIGGLVLRYAAIGAEKAQRADRKVRDTLKRTSKTARKESKDIGKWMEAHKTAIAGIALATLGLMGAVAGAAPNVSARLAGIRIAFSLLATAIGRELDPAFKLAQKLAFGLADAYRSLPSPIRKALAWTLLLVAAVAGLSLATLGLIKVFAPVVAVVKTFIGWLAAGSAGALAAAAAIGTLIGFLTVLALDAMGVLDWIENVASSLGGNLSDGAKTALIGVTNFLLLGIPGVLAALGALIVNWVRGDWQKGWDEAVRMLKITFLDPVLALGDLAEQAWTWGSDLIDEFIAGLKARTPSLSGALSKTKETITSWLGFEVPANDRMAQRWGRDLAHHFSRGVEGADGRVEHAVQAVSPVGGGEDLAPSPGGPTGGGGTTVILNIEEGAVQIMGAMGASGFDMDRMIEEIVRAVQEKFGGRSL